MTKLLSRYVLYVAVFYSLGYCLLTPKLLSWREWTFVFIWLNFVGGSIAFILTSLWEREKQAAFRAGLIMIIFIIITGALVLRFVL